MDVRFKQFKASGRNCVKMSIEGVGGKQVQVQVKCGDEFGGNGAVQIERGMKCSGRQI